MEVSLDSILLSLILGCLAILVFRNNPNESSLSSPKSTPSKNDKSPRIRRRKSTITDEYSSQDVFRIVLTGGPCAGKTTGINKLASELSNSAKVLVVPEASTLLVKGGAINNFEGLDNNAQVEFQASLMQLQMALEDAFTQIASSVQERSIVICDRGLMDGSAYISPELWQALLDERGWTVVHLRDRRYEAVVHMVTAADGADSYYSLNNNLARHEGLELAIEVDQKLQRAWTGHSHFSVIDNHSSQNFEDKINNLLTKVLRFMGTKTNGAWKKKILIKSEGKVPAIDNLQVVKILIDDTYLKTSDDNVAKIQKRGQSGSYIYNHCTKKNNDFDDYCVNKCQITAREYIFLRENKDVSRKTVKRVRQCFIYHSNYFMIDTYLNVKQGVSVLRTDVLDLSSLKLPPEISIVRDVSDDPGYSTYIMSKINWYVSSEDKNSIIE